MEQNTALSQVRYTVLILLRVRGLTVVRVPLTFGDLHLREGCLERGILGAACVDAKANGSAALPHMTNAHLPESDAVCGAFDQIIVFATTEAVPHGFDVGVDFGGCPIGVALLVMTLPRCWKRSFSYSMEALSQFSLSRYMTIPH